jgi:hypothetical protein
MPDKDVAGARAMVQHLRSLGYQRIAHITGPDSNCESGERLRGYRAAMGREQSARSLVLQGNFTEQSGYQAGRQIAAADDRARADHGARPPGPRGIGARSRGNRQRSPRSPYIDYTVGDSRLVCGPARISKPPQRALCWHGGSIGERNMKKLYERVRGFLILHYHATERNDSPFWNYCRTMPIPDSLANVIRLFRDSGRYFRNADEMSGQVSWVEVMIGQGIMPAGYHPMVGQMSAADLYAFLDHAKLVVSSSVAAMPMHQQFIDRHCKAAPAPAAA